MVRIIRVWQGNTKFAGAPSPEYGLRRPRYGTKHGVQHRSGRCGNRQAEMTRISCARILHGMPRPARSTNERRSHSMLHCTQCIVHAR